MSTTLYDNACTGTDGASASTCVQSTGANPFTIDSGTAVIASNRIYNNGAGPACVVRTNEALATADYRVKVTLRCLTDNTAFSIYARYTGTNSYDFTYSSGNLYLRKTVGGVNTVFQTVSWSPSAGTDYEFELAVSGTSVRGYLDGVEKFTPVTDSAVGSAQQAGVLLVPVGALNTPSVGMHVKRVQVIDPAGGVTVACKASLLLLS